MEVGGEQQRPHLTTTTGPAAGRNLPGAAPGESGWNSSPAGASGIPSWVETGRGRGGGGRTRRMDGMEGAGKRKRSEGVGDLERHR